MKELKNCIIKPYYYYYSIRCNDYSPSIHRSPYFIDGSWRVENEKGMKTETQ